MTLPTTVRPGCPVGERGGVRIMSLDELPLRLPPMKERPSTSEFDVTLPNTIRVHSRSASVRTTAAARAGGTKASHRVHAIRQVFFMVS